MGLEVSNDILEIFNRTLHWSVLKRAHCGLTSYFGGERGVCRVEEGCGG